MVLLPLSLLLIPVGYLYLWPLVERLFGGGEDPLSPLEIGLSALALSIGALAWLMFWIGLLPGAYLSGASTLAVVLLGGITGLLLNRAWLAPARWAAYWRTWWRRLWRFDIESLLVWAMIGISVIMLVNALYYPFVGDDTISRYGLQAQQIYRARRIPDKVSGYPPLTPLVFTATWFASGGMNEHLAKLFPVVMAMGTIGAAYVIGRRVLNRDTGLLAAVLVAVTPTLIRYGTLGYIDIPTTFPLTLAVFYTLRWWRTRQVRDAVFTGILAGIGLFTKQSALTWLASLAAVPVLWLLASRRGQMANRWRDALLGMAGFLLPPLLIAAPWYIRNIILDGWGNVLPVAGLYHILGDQVGWLGLFPSIARPRDFGPLLGWAYAIGWIGGLARAAWQGINPLQGRLEKPPFSLIMAAFVIPYWLAWWTRFSFDGRFLALILPLLAVWTAEAILPVIHWISRKVTLPRPIWGVITALLLAGFSFWGAYDRLGAVYQAVTNPFASESERLLHTKGSMYDLVLYIREHFDPETDRLMLMDGRLLYYLGDYNVEVMYPLSLDDLRGYDYLIHSSSIYSVYNNRLGWRESEFYQHAWDPLIFEPVYVSGGVHIMRILRTDVPTPEEYEAFQESQQ